MLVVQKYGGTSVRDVQRIQNVARRAIDYKKRGTDVIVVVSAMSGETDRLLSLAQNIAKFPDLRETDVLISTGEQVTSALLAISLIEMGYKAISLLADQIRIISDSTYGFARIASIEEKAVRAKLDEGNIIIVPGFQGVDESGSITTLGRGGSDTTAVALAAGLKADLCEIYTDVDGVYTTDPNICEKARRLDRISYEEMLEMASLGAKVLQIRSVELAQKYNVPILVKSSLIGEGRGTLVCKEERDMMEKVVISGITYNKNEAKITVSRVPDKPGIASKIFTALSEASIVVDMIVQNVSHDGFNDITFTVVKTDARKAFTITKAIGESIGAKVAVDEDMAKVSIVGIGMRSHSGVASKMFSVLAAEGINIQLISTSEIKISCVIESKYGELAVRALHTNFGLDAEDVTEEA
ncbi:MAG: aspartate kinase [Syntrophorhabdaceae bacterium]|nr:aspartate kinase [Syntrophorhabdaceae bacterium]MDD4196493.1 aspartate kinase [Syntrophorhabdaceae bacterium]HOC45116.1 aspartate kinase [Syntrophorhabdaceae bacterium]